MKVLRKLAIIYQSGLHFFFNPGAGKSPLKISEQINPDFLFLSRLVPRFVVVLAHVFLCWSRRQIHNLHSAVFYSVCFVRIADQYNIAENMYCRSIRIADQ